MLSCLVKTDRIETLKNRMLSVPRYASIEQAKIIVPYCLMIVVYLFLMNKIGYIASTVVFMLASLIYLKLKNKVLMVILTVALTVVVYFVFTNFLTVILPRGSWFNIAF